MIMKLSTKGRYGLRAMIDLALYSEKEPASIARLEFKSIKEDLDRYQERLDEIEKKADEILPKIKNVDKLFEIKGVG